MLSPKIKLVLTAFLVGTLSALTGYSATFVVDNEGDVDNLAAYTAADGTNTLRKCIRLANANAGLDNIEFNIPAGDAPFIIVTGAALPAITSPVFIDGLTQPGATAGNLLIQVDGEGGNVLELNTGSGGSTIRGLVIYGTNRGLFIINSSDNTIVANHIGTNVGATAVAPTTIIWNGIEIDNSNNTIIGGITGATTRNIISGCQEQGIRIQNNSTGTQIMGNYIGTDITGAASIPNGQNGILILPGCTGTVIGGATANHRNIISGNGQRGMLIENATNCIVQNNFIGTTLTGNAAMGNATRGIEVVNNSHDVQILDNVICSNGQIGTGIYNCDRPIVRGNKFGLGFNGTTALGNGEHGMEIVNAASPVVGGSTSAERNYASNNAFCGMIVNNGDNGVVRGNYIGVDATGLLDHGNGQVGLYIIATDNITIGGAVAGQGNIVSGNAQHGIAIAADPTSGAIIKGNIVGLGADITTAIPNLQMGIEITNCENSVIGGTTLAERNYISSNGGVGMQLASSPYSTVIGNYVGVDGTGLLNRGNFSDNIRVVNSREVTVGGINKSYRNVVGGSVASNGIVLDGDSRRCVIKGNFVGIGADGVTDIGNWASGIYLLATSDTATIGGSTFMERNVSSCNGKSTVGDGIRIEGPDGHTVLGNYCGVDSTGTIKKGNSWAGISMNESNDNLIGGSGAFQGNICSGNLNEGMYLRNASRNLIYGNFVGTDKTGTIKLGNEDFGINISAAGPNFDNVIGGTLTNANTIAFNLNDDATGPGVIIADNSHRNLITYNKIYCNAGLGIERFGAGNENVAAPVITLSDATTVSGTGNIGYTIHVYRNVTSDGGVACDCEGEIFIGTTTVLGDGTWELPHGLGLSVPDAGAVTATQTNATNSTSQFSNCIIPLPVNYLYFKVSKYEDTKALLSWATAWELNNKEFIIEKSYDGNIFFPIATIPGNKNTSVTTPYSYVDEMPGASVVYYRILQVDFDGQSSYSPIRHLSFDEDAIKVITLPGKELQIEYAASTEGSVSIIVHSSSGQVCYEGNFEVAKGLFDHKVSLQGFSTGIYLVKVRASEEQVVKKVMIR